MSETAPMNTGTYSSGLYGDEAIYNLTPHAVVFRDENGEVAGRIEPCGTEARLAETASDGFTAIGGIVVRDVSYGAADGLPGPQPGVLFIVPLATALAVRAAGDTRRDLLVPGAQTRDEHGTVNGCRELWRVA